MKEVKAVIQKVVIHFRQDCNLSAAKTFTNWPFKMLLFKPDTRTGSNKTLFFGF